VHVPYKGSGEAMPDVLAGNIQVMMDVIVFAQAKAGKLTLLASVDSVRNPDFPDVPTLQEAGFPQYDMPNFYVLAAPAGTPAEAIRILNASAVKVAKQPEFAKRMLSNGYRLATDTPEQVKDRLATLAPKYAQHMKDVDFRVE
jgi:tripartite-type tricarboxylate transporter receptor subunit TctC